MIFSNLFGEEVVIATESQDNTDILKDTWTLEQLAFASLKQLKKSDPESFYKKLVKKIFIEDIEKIIKIDELWKDRFVPIPISEDELLNVMTDFKSENDHEIWELTEWIYLFKRSIFKLLKRCEIISFDKDDSDTLDFVASSANIRSKIFGIKLESKFEIKAMAGNIIPAIATTNSIAAAMIIIHARNILNNNTESMCNAYINYGSNRNVFTIEKPCPPNHSCSTCSTDQGIIKLNCKIVTIKKLIEIVLPNYLQELRKKFPDSIIKEIDEEDLILLEGNRLLYDIEDDNGNGSKSLDSLNLTDSKFIKFDLSPRRPLILCIDQNQNEIKQFKIEDDSVNDLDTFAQIDFDLIEPIAIPIAETLLEPVEPVEPAESKESVESEEDDDLICIDEKDDFNEIIENSVKKKAKIEEEPKL